MAQATTPRTTYASDRARVNAGVLRNALVDMVIRYGEASLMEGSSMLVVGPDSTGRTWEYWHRAAARRFQAIQRLSAALRDVE